MICRLRVESAEGIRTFPLREGETCRLGASRDNEVALTKIPGISRRHAELRLEGGGLRIRDLGSKNRLLFEGERRRQVLLHPGMAVQIGKAFVSLEELPISEVEIAITLDGSPEIAATPATGTDPVQSGSRTAAAALAFVRQAQKSRWLEDEERRRFLARARELLGACSMLRFPAAVDHSSTTLIIKEASGSLPPEELSRHLAELDPSPEARWAKIDTGWSCLWMDSPSMCPKPSAGSSILVALFNEDGQGVAEPEPWIFDFFDYLAERLGTDSMVSAQADQPGVTPPEEIDLPPGMVLGEAPAIRELLEQIRASLGSRSDVLLLGETGTGKEVFAQLLHRSGPTVDGPFVAINCAAIPSEQLEAELFGIGKGVATGVDARIGRFESAAGGTLFLDEVAELPPELQAKLLRVLEEREVLPVGAPRAKKINLRVISACNCDLRDRVRRGVFREDLYYRLDRLRFVIPPLRERREDIPVLVTAFVRREASRANRRLRGVSRRALALLQSYPWPGNVRELRNAVERAVSLCRDFEALESRHFAELAAAILPSSEPTIPAADPSPRPAPEPALAGAEPQSLEDQLAAEEERILREELARCGGNRSKTARRLGISRQGLYNKLDRYGIA